VKRRFEDFDRVFFAVLMTLLATGLVVVFSACQTEEVSRVSALWRKQIAFAGIGLAGFFLTAAIPHMLWSRMAPSFYVLSLGLLVLVLVAGSAGGGATRWLAIGPLRFQPSEIAKLATVLYLARVLSGRRRPAESFVDLLGPGILVLLPTALVLKQPDLGTALVFLILAPPMLFFSGVPLKYLALLSAPLVSIVCAFSLPSWIVFTVLLLALAYTSRALVTEKIVIVSLSIVMGIVTPVLFERLEPYQQQRLKSFINPPDHPGDPPTEETSREPLAAGSQQDGGAFQEEGARDAGQDALALWKEELAAYRSYISGAGYQIIQSKVAVGSGGALGQGFLQGTQKKLAFLPARHTDFIFSVVGEEFGFLGTVAVLALFTVLIARGFRIAAAARDPFAGLTAVGILSMLAFQVFVNIGVALGLVPVTGLPLPIYSYGGTSLVTTLASLGVVMGVGLRRRM
jgi:rod shape determining protein RodA